MLNRLLPYVTAALFLTVGFFALAVSSTGPELEVASIEDQATLDTFTLDEVAMELFGVTASEAREGKRGKRDGHNSRGKRDGKKHGYGGHHKKKDKHCKPKKKKKKEKKKERKPPERDNDRKCKCPYNLILKHGQCYDWHGNLTRFKPPHQCRRPTFNFTPVPVYQYQTGAGSG